MFSVPYLFIRQFYNMSSVLVSSEASSPVANPNPELGRKEKSGKIVPV